jgi:hypothetical protein
MQKIYKMEDFFFKKNTKDLINLFLNKQAQQNQHNIAQ